MSRVFEKVYIEISDICGLNCSFCPSPKGRRGVMSFGLFERICNLIQGRAKLITFHILGDPLLCEGLPIYLQIAQEYGLKVEIVTSGYYLQKWDYALLLDSPISQCNISLSAFSDLSNPSPSQYLQTILAFCLFHQHIRSECFLNLRIHKSRVQKELVKLFCSYFSVEDQFENDRIRLGYKLFLRLSKDFIWIRQSPQHFKNKEKFCHGLISQIGFLSNGEVVPCCIDCDGGIILGNIQFQTLDEILSSPRAKGIKHGFLNGIAVEEQCQRCSYPAKAKMD